MSIEGVISQPEGCDFHEDERRVLISPYNSDIGGFECRQSKILIAKKDCILGGKDYGFGHWHPYRELFGMHNGNARFILENVDSKQREIYELKSKGRLLIADRVAHVVLVKAGSVLMGHTEEPYSKERHDNRYHFDNLPQEFLDLMQKPKA